MRLWHVMLGFGDDLGELRDCLAQRREFATIRQHDRFGEPKAPGHNANSATEPWAQAQCRPIRSGPAEQVCGFLCCHATIKEPPVSKETPKDDPRRETDWKNTKQTDEPWNGPVEKEQKPGGPPPDLEKWHETSTH
jgi:hypothetical protein